VRPIIRVCVERSNSSADAVTAYRLCVRLSVGAAFAPLFAGSALSSCDVVLGAPEFSSDNAYPRERVNLFWLACYGRTSEENAVISKTALGPEGSAGGAWVPHASRFETWGFSVSYLVPRAGEGMK